jgi:hypothetical protein
MYLDATDSGHRVCYLEHLVLMLRFDRRSLTLRLLIDGAGCFSVTAAEP